MKKLCFAILILTVVFMLFSCAYGTVRPPDLTRPDLTLPLPDKWDPFEKYVHESNNWIYDPDPNDDTRIYGGTYDNVTFVLTLDDSIASLAVMVSEKVTKAELLRLGLEGSDYTCNTVYSLTDLTYTYSDSDGGNIVLLKADSFQMFSAMNIESSDGADVSEFITKRTTLLDELVKQELVSQSEAESKKAYLNGKTAVTVGSSLNISVLLDEEKGVCRVDSIDCMIDGKQHKLTHTFKLNTLEEKNIEVESEMTKLFNYSANGASRVDTYYRSDGSSYGVWTHFYYTGEVLRCQLLLKGYPKKLQIYFFENGKIEAKTSYRQGNAEESSIRYNSFGRITSQYYVEDGRGYDITYYDDGTKKSEYICEVDAETFKRGALVSSTYWYEDGSVRSETKVEDGKTVTERYSEDGTVLERVERENAVTRTFKYYADGKKQSIVETEYDDHGYSHTIGKMEWYENGTLKYELSAKINGYINYEREYDENGVLIFERTNVEPPVIEPAIN
jgi:antitoxin component YwqK of YwqJK toxin-antitoxin module